MGSKKGLRLNASAGMNIDGESRGTKGDIEFPYLSRYSTLGLSFAAVLKVVVPAGRVQQGYR